MNAVLALALLTLGAVVGPAVVDAAGECVMPTRRGGPADAKPNDPRLAMRDQLARVDEVVRLAPSVAQPPNLRLRPRIVSGWDDGFPFLPAPPNGPFPAYYTLSAYTAGQWDGTCGIKDASEWASQLVIIANSIGTVIWNQKMPVLKDEAGGMHPEPRLTGQVAGFPMYENRAVVVTNIRRPFLVPVSVERVLRARLAERRQDLAKVEAGSQALAGSSPSSTAQTTLKQMEAQYEGMKQMDQVYEQMKAVDPKTAAELQRSNAKALADLQQSIEKARRELPAGAAKATAINREALPELRRGMDDLREKIRRLEARLEVLSPAERQAQAHYGGVGADEWLLNKPGASDALRLVAVNPDFFDASAPRAALQVLTVIPREGTAGDAGLFARRVLESLDYARLAALLTR